MAYEVTKIEVFSKDQENTSIGGAQVYISAKESTLQAAKLLNGVEKSYDKVIK